MTRDGAANLVTRICGSYLIKPGPGYVDAWFEALRGVDDATAHEALTRHVRDSERPPRPADLLRIAGGVRRPMSESPGELMHRLNRRASAQVAERLSRGDEEELRFQRWMRRRFELTETLTPELEAYFHRIGVEP